MSDREWNPYSRLTDGELAILGGGGRLGDGRNDRDVANTKRNKYSPREFKNDAEFVALAANAMNGVLNSGWDRSPELAGKMERRGNVYVDGKTARFKMDYEGRPCVVTVTLPAEAV